MTDELIRTLQQECEAMRRKIKEDTQLIASLREHILLLDEEIKRLDGSLKQSYDEIAQLRFDA